MKVLSFPWLFLLVLWVLCGWSQAGPDFSVKVDETRGVTKGSKVIWRGAEIGEVTDLAMQEGRFRLEARLADAYRGQLHRGVRAQVANGLLTRFTPVLELFGGTDAGAPLLPRGAAVEVSHALGDQVQGWWPVAGFALLAAIFLFIVGKIVRGLVRLALFLAVLGLVIAAVVFGLYGTRQRRESLASDLQAKWSDLANTTIHSPEGVSAWAAARRQLEALLQKGKQEGSGAPPSRAAMAETLDGRIAALRKSGHAEAADELAEFRRKLLATPERP